MSGVGNSAKLKQMKITDSFSKAKLEKLRVEKTFSTSGYVICIDSSDSDADGNEKIFDNDSCNASLESSEKTIAYYEYYPKIKYSKNLPGSSQSLDTMEQNGNSTDQLILNCIDESQDSTQNTNQKALALKHFSSTSDVISNQEPEQPHLKDEPSFHSKQLTEFRAIFKMVTENEHLSNVLTSESKHILNKFLQMQKIQQYFVMKLFIWKENWYNVLKFSQKAEICMEEQTILKHFKFLATIKFVLADFKNSDSMENVLKQLNKNQLKEIMDELKIFPIKGTKDELIQNISKATVLQTTLSKMSLKDLVLIKIEKKMGFAIKLHHMVRDSFQTAYLLATFANPDLNKIQDFFKILVYKKYTFPILPLEEYMVFSSNKELVEYAQALKMYENMELCLSNNFKDNRKSDIYNMGLHVYNLLQSLDANILLDQKKASHLKRFTAVHVYLKIITICCEKLYTKQNGFPSTVRTWLQYLIRRFPQSRNLGKWYKILIWLSMRHLEPINYEKSAQLLIEAFESKGNILGEKAKAELCKLGHSLKSSKKFRISQFYCKRISELIPLEIDPSIFPHQYIDSNCIRSNVSGKKRVYVSREEGATTYKTVEDVALHYYRKNGFTGGEKCEGSLLKALMILVFWDIIYDPQTVIPGSFISKFQKAPLDFMTHNFFENRKEAIHLRLQEIEFRWPKQELLNFATKMYKEHAHEWSAFGVINNIIEDVDIVRILFCVIKREILAKVFERLIKNTKEFGSGMPDLLIWDVDKEVHKFVEVKGEGDQLSITQKIWLAYLKEIGASVEICIVHSIGSKRKKVKRSFSKEEDV